MTDRVNYQLERAVDALRTAMELGAATADSYLLRCIAETITTIEGWQSSSRYKLNIKEEESHSNSWYDFDRNDLDRTNPFITSNSTYSDDIVKF